MSELLDQTCRVAFSALIHDIGKFSQCAGQQFSQDFFDSSIKPLCPALEEEFSLTSANAYQPLQQAVVLEADRVARGSLEKSSNDKGISAKSRLLTLFEQIDVSENKSPADKRLNYRYPLVPMSVQSIFPDKDEKITPHDEQKAKGEYTALWNGFLKGLKKIPEEHKQNWSLWLDHFDSLWLAYTQAIPSTSYKNLDVSVYDHGKVTAAIATSLWRWYRENQKDETAAVNDLNNEDSRETKQLLFVQGDFFGVQGFVFAEGSLTNKGAAKILRGRSFYVSLVSELAALKVLDALELPSTNLIQNAAGKFLIIAPNTDAAVQKLNLVKQEIETWFIKKTLGVAGLGIATCPVSRTELVEKNISELMKELFSSLETVKYQRMDLVGNDAPTVMNVDYSKGCCQWNRFLPAEEPEKSSEKPCNSLTLDQIKIGEALVRAKEKRLAILTENISLPSESAVSLKNAIFGYHIIFCDDNKVREKISGCVKAQTLRRYWDFSMPIDKSEELWNGCARRNINGYVPRFRLPSDKAQEPATGGIKLFDDLASEGAGIDALGCLKGDVDNLGLIIQRGLVGAKGDSLCLAKMSALSRQLNLFFSVYLPYLCQKEYPLMYTIFAGGDDFFLVGPWYMTQEFARKIRKEFSAFCASSPQLHFSVGIATVKSGITLRGISGLAEKALEKAKHIDGKDAVTVFDYPVKWTTLEELYNVEKNLYYQTQADSELRLNSSYLYSLFYMLEEAEREKEDKIPEASIWRSRLSYKNNRWISDKAKREKAKERMSFNMQKLLSVTYEPIDKFRGSFRIPLSNVFYRLRK